MHVLVWLYALLPQFHPVPLFKAHPTMYGDLGPPCHIPDRPTSLLGIFSGIFDSLKQKSFIYMSSSNRFGLYLWVLASWNAQVYRQAFWLGLLGGFTPKRLIAWSNDKLIAALDLGKLCAQKKNLCKENRQHVPQLNNTKLQPYIYIHT